MTHSSENVSTIISVLRLGMKKTALQMDQETFSYLKHNFPLPYHKPETNIKVMGTHFANHPKTESENFTAVFAQNEILQENIVGIAHPYNWIYKNLTKIIDSGGVYREMDLAAPSKLPELVFRVLFTCPNQEGLSNHIPLIILRCVKICTFNDLDGGNCISCLCVTACSRLARIFRKHWPERKTNLMNIRIFVFRTLIVATGAFL